MLFFIASAASAADLLDFVIDAVDPTLAPARPLIECLAGGGDAEQCALEAAKKQASGMLPVGLADDRLKLAVDVFSAAREERWFDVLNIGGAVVAKSVSCAVLPLQGPIKGAACAIVGWVISHHAKTLDQAWAALRGPDWWALIDVLGTAACDLIPGDGPAGYAKEVVCGPLAAVLLEAKLFGEAFAKSVVAGADALENFVFGNDSHMPYERYFALYWQPWYHYSTAHIWRGEALGPAVNGVYDTCVDYFDSHNQYRKTAVKTCGDLKQKFDRQVQGFAAALPVAVDGYFQTIAKPAIRGFARHGFGKPTPTELPGENLFVLNCAFQIHRRFPFPEADDARCQLLADQAKHFGNGPFGMRFQSLAKMCFSQIQQQTLDPTVWEMACDEMRSPYRQAYTGETLRLMQSIGELKHEGCSMVDPKRVQKLRLECPSLVAHAACLSALAPDGDKYCVRPALHWSDSQSRSGPAVAAMPLASSPARSERAAPSAPSDRAPPASTERASPRLLAAARQAISAAVVFEAEALSRDGKIRIQGGTAGVQTMSGFGPRWGGDAQLFWRGGVGAALDLLLEVPYDGAWQVEIALTQAPDYADLAFEVDQHPVARRFDGYAPAVAGPVTLPLGVFAMRAGSRAVSLKIIGRNRAASGWLVGIDRIALKPDRQP